MRLFTAFLIALLSVGPIFAAPGDRLAEVVSNPVRDCGSGWNGTMPLIAWGADGVVAYANGAPLENAGGPLGDARLPLSLSVEDSFEAQLKAYLSCETPCLRGTLGMLAAAAPVTEYDARTEQIVFFKHSFSAGDGIVAAEGINRISDLKGKRIAIQASMAVQSGVTGLAFLTGCCASSPMIVQPTNPTMAMPMMISRSFIATSSVQR